MLDKLKFVEKNLSPGLKKIIHNIGWLSAERILNMTISFFVGIYVIRYLGAENFGKLSYSISFVALFTAISKLGLDQIVIRNLVKEKNTTLEVLGTAFILKFIGSLLAIGLTFVSIQYATNDIEIYKMTIIIALGLIFSSFGVLDLWYQSQVLSKPIAIARSIQFIISSIAKIIFIILKFPVIAFAYLLLTDSIIRAIAIIIVYTQSNQSIFRWKIKKSSAINLLKDSWLLVMSNVMVTIYMKMDQVMLGNMSSTQEVGNYAAAVRFSEVCYFIPMIICSSVFPSIIKAKQRSLREYIAKIQKLYDFMILLSLFIAVFITFTSDLLIIKMLGSEYSVAGKILIVHIWSGIFIFLGVARDKWLIAENAVSIHFATQLFGALTNVLLNLIFIPKYGAIGAAISTLISYGIFAYLSCFIFPSMFHTGWMLTKSLLFPFRFKKIIRSFQQ